MIGARAYLRFELGIATGLLVVLALAALPERAVAVAVADYEIDTARADEPIRLTSHSPSPREEAELAYRTCHFERAADLIGGIRPSDVDLQNLALQYEQLASAWRTGMDEAAPIIDQHEALAIARKLDIVLGGAHADRIEARQREVAAPAARAYMERKDYESARRAVELAQLLGVRDETTATVGETLAGHLDRVE
jgi:hypothetical protein